MTPQPTTASNSIPTIALFSRQKRIIAPTIDVAGGSCWLEFVMASLSYLFTYLTAAQHHGAEVRVIDLF